MEFELLIKQINMNRHYRQVLVDLETSNTVDNWHCKIPKWEGHGFSGMILHITTREDVDLSVVKWKEKLIKSVIIKIKDVCKLTFYPQKKQCISNWKSEEDNIELDDVSMYQYANGINIDIPMGAMEVPYTGFDGTCSVDINVDNLLGKNPESETLKLEELEIENLFLIDNMVLEVIYYTNKIEPDLAHIFFSEDTQFPEEWIFRTYTTEIRAYLGNYRKLNVGILTQLVLTALDSEKEPIPFNSTCQVRFNINGNDVIESMPIMYLRSVEGLEVRLPISIVRPVLHNSNELKIFFEEMDESIKYVSIRPLLEQRNVDYHPSKEHGQKNADEDGEDGEGGEDTGEDGEDTGEDGEDGEDTGEDDDSDDVPS